MSKKTRVAILRITNCEQCQHLEIGPSYSLDGFDRGNDWKCKRADREIAGFVEWRESDKPKTIPEWCPLLGVGKR